MTSIARYVIVIFAIGWLSKEIIFPGGIAIYYSNLYMKLTVECDTAMEASWYYQQDENFSEEAEIVQLLSCHEYDKVRKIMLFSGLPEEYLSWLGLKSLEIYQRPAEEYVEQHRFNQR